mmetsp:Transcript_56167/g.105820  ORF Transcript_56167/g.105820 Transcript_56167/m.105820 type:complete len:144 (+) Transcript_56167:88-519(+)
MRAVVLVLACMASVVPVQSAADPSQALAELLQAGTPKAAFNLPGQGIRSPANKPAPSLVARSTLRPDMKMALEDQQMQLQRKVQASAVALATALLPLAAFADFEEFWEDLSPMARFGIGMPTVSIGLIALSIIYEAIFPRTFT